MEETVQPTKTPQGTRQTINIWALSGELGLMIAVPLVVLILMGIKIDKFLGTTPLFIIAGMIFSLIISTIAIVRKVKRLSP